MMLSRSCLADDLKNSFSTLLRNINGTGEDGGQATAAAARGRLLRRRHRGGYLPYRTHPAYDRLAEDWMALLRLGLPAHDAYLGISCHSGRFTSCCTKWRRPLRGGSWRSRPLYVCEVIAPKMEFVRQRAIRCFLDNDGLPRIALRHSRQRP